MQLKLFDFVRGFRRAGKKRKRLKKPIRPKNTPRPISDRELQALWCGLRRHFFPHRPDLDNYKIYWSGRGQKRTLASCNIERQVVRVARELNYEEHKQWLSPLLYHEMCHAVLGYSVYAEYGRSSWHGKEFRQLERRHHSIKKLDSWIESGGWAKAVRSDRAKRAYQKKIKTKKLA